MNLSGEQNGVAKQPITDFSIGQESTMLVEMPRRFVPTLEQILDEYRDAHTRVKGSWTRKEDAILKDLVGKYGARKWKRIAMHLIGRVGKQCRERWMNHLDPRLDHTEFREDEDLLIMRLHTQFGNQWSKISRYLQGRTPNKIKNRWNSCLCKKEEDYEGLEMIEIDRIPDEHDDGTGDPTPSRKLFLLGKGPLLGGLVRDGEEDESSDEEEDEDEDDDEGDKEDDDKNDEDKEEVGKGKEVDNETTANPPQRRSKRLDAKRKEAEAKMKENGGVGEKGQMKKKRRRRKKKKKKPRKKKRRRRRTRNVFLGHPFIKGNIPSPPIPRRRTSRATIKPMNHPSPLSRFHHRTFPFTFTSAPQQAVYDDERRNQLKAQVKSENLGIKQPQLQPQQLQLPPQQQEKEKMEDDDEERVVDLLLPNNSIPSTNSPSEDGLGAILGDRRKVSMEDEK